MQLFVVSTLAAFAFLALRGELSGNLDLLLELPLPFLVILLVQSGLDVFLGGLRIWALTRAFGSPMSLVQANVANGANIFLGGITPSQTGGAAAQLYLLMRSGLPFHIASVVSVVGFLGTVVSLLVAGLVVALVHPGFAFPVGLRFFSAATVSVFSAVLLVFLLAIPVRGKHGGWLRFTARRLPILGPRLARSRSLQRFEATLADFAALVREGGSRRLEWIAAGLLLSALIYLDKFVVAYVLLHGFGFATPLSEVLYLQVVQCLIMYFAPTPGASGVAEITAARIMSPVVPESHFTAYVILWRTFTLYVPMAVGGLLLLREVLRVAPAERVPSKLAETDRVLR